ncbi:hypothetical protein NXX04_16455 [Bacteroides ovatus]|nr:hypothetical protein [Bacteroides ovatus]
MNVLEHYVTEIIGEPYYDDYGSGNYHWWLKVKALCYGSECETTLMFVFRSVEQPKTTRNIQA